MNNRKKHVCPKAEVCNVHKKYDAQFTDGCHHATPHFKMSDSGCTIKCHGHICVPVED